MSSSFNLRDAATIQEEISDLREYFDGLPKELRDSGAFSSYEYRMVALNRELVQGMLYNSYLKPEKTAVPTADEFCATIDRQLAALEREHKSSADRYSTVTQVLQFALLAGTACTLTAAAAPLHTIVPVTLSAISAAVAAVLSFSRFPDRARKEERLADYFKALRNETANILTSAGEINVEPRYYENSTKTIQSIIHDIGAQSQTQ